MPSETWHQVISSNLDSTFHGCRAVITQMMRQRFGRIINISSLSAIMPPLGQTNYAAAKAGVVALGRALAKETARAGITVNSILPGYIETDALGALLNHVNYCDQIKPWTFGIRALQRNLTERQMWQATTFERKQVL